MRPRVLACRLPSIQLVIHRLLLAKALGSPPDEHASPPFSACRRVPEHKLVAGELIGPNVVCADFS